MNDVKYAYFNDKMRLGSFTARSFILTSREFQEDQVLVRVYKVNYLKVGNGSHNILCLPGALGNIWTDFKPQIEGFDHTNLGMVCVGISMGWTSPVLVKLSDSNNPPLGHEINATEGSWIVSVNLLSGFITVFLAAFVLDIFGRKNCMILFAFPKLIGFVILVFTNQYWLILCARVACGLSDGAAFVAVNMYVSEIASTEIRGRLGIMMQISVTIGMVMMYCVGPFLDYYTLNALILCIMVVFTVPLFFIPESPYFLYRKGQRAESTRVLEKLHGTYELAIAAVKDYESTLDREETMKFMEILKSKSVLKALVIGCLVNIGGQVSGANVVQSYMQTILEMTRTSVSSNIASVILGIIQLLACLCTVFIIDRVGRKPIIIVCLSGVTLGLLGMGTFFRISDQSEENTGFINYVPLISMILVILFNSAGIGSIIWPLVAELFNGRTRTFGMTCVQLSGLTFMFLSVRFFPAIASEIGPSNLFFINSVMAVLLCLFVVFCVPETKGKSFVEIQQTLGQGNKGVDDGVLQAA